MYKYKQSTLMTCGPSCILMLMKYFDKNIKLTQKHELNILNKSLILPIREAFEFGFAVYASEKGFKSKFYVGTKHFKNQCHSLIKRGFGKNIKVINKKITTEDVKKELLNNLPLILEIDCYVINKQIHFPHYIIITNYKNNLFNIIDPFDGKSKKLNESVLAEGIENMRKLFLTHPILICLSK